jgi:tight adherence protein B
VIGVVLAVVAAYGTFLLFTAAALGWRGVGVGPERLVVTRPRRRFGEWLVQAGVEQVRTSEFLAVAATLFVVGAGAGWALFGGVLAPIAAGLGAASLPFAVARGRRERRIDHAREAWPRMIEEIRLQATSLGRSIPQALFTVGRRAPDELRPAFEAAHREWLMSTDFDRTLRVLKARLADATADAVCETLLIAHEVGGGEVDRRLRALIDDRIQDLQGRKDARSEQAGARFARAFVLIVPLGMAGVGLSIGEGRAAYQSSLGQAGVLTALVLISLCWWWASRLMRIPDEQRVFLEDES